MSFLSLAFAVFVAIALAIYFFMVPKKYQWCALLAFSYIFYAFAGWKLFFFILFTTCTVFFCAQHLNKVKNHKAKIGIIALVMTANFSILAFFKWFNTLAGLGNRLLDAIVDPSVQIPTFSFLLPLGISFYTFQAVGYLIDVSRKKIEPERNFARFALFVSFFPQLVQGPISRHSELAEQLYASRNFDYDEFRRGFQLVIWGLFKKLVIADRLVLMAAEIFNSPETYNGLYYLFGGMISFVKLYADFSGGVDIARGVAQMFGITMPLNFLRPFFSKNLSEFWRRWHITLNFWWRDYLFYPFVLSKAMTRFSKFIRTHISTNFGKVVAVYLGIYFVRIINAMWHGADLYLIAGGFYHGFLITTGLMLAPVFIKMIHFLHINTDCFPWKLFQAARTFLIISFGQILWNAGSVRDGLAAMISVFRDFNPSFDSLFLSGIDAREAGIAIVSVLILIIVEIVQEKGVSIRITIEKQNIAFQWIMLLGLIFATILWGRYGIEYEVSDFIYQGF